jgi:hypothetical protein
MGSTEPGWRGGPKKPAGGRATSARKKEGHGNGYKHKCHHLEGLCREKEMFLARLEVKRWALYASPWFRESAAVL